MERALGSRYRLDSLLGGGAMGQVFSGVDNEGNRFAFKVLRSDLAGDPDLVARFLQERSILTGIRHPNLVSVHDLVAEGETLAIVMDLVPGGDLRVALTAAGTFLPAEVARIGAGVAAALAAVHGAGVVHRDVKPENILLDDSTALRIPRLTDFGIARFARQTSSGRSSLLAGTPQYVAPELANGEEPTPGADLYSLGIVLYELCCGVTPFAGGSTLAVIRQHAEVEPGRPDGIPDPLWELIAWLLAKTPRARPQSAQQVATVLDALSGELVNAPLALRLTTPPPGHPIAHQQQTTTVPDWPGGAPTVGPGFGPAFVPGGPVPSKSRRGRRVVLSLIAVAVVLIGGLIIGNSLRSSSGGTSSGTNAGADTVQNGQPAGVATSDTTTTPPSADHTPQTRYLDELTPANGEWSSSTRTAQLGGQHYSDALVTSVDSCGYSSQPDDFEYNLSKGYRMLTGVAGVDDSSSDSAFQIQLDIYGDGNQLIHQIVQLGSPYQINTDVTGVLRLKIVVTVIGNSNDPNCGSQNYFAIGSAALHGVTGEIPLVTDTPTG